MNRRSPPAPSTPRPKDPPIDAIVSIENEIGVQMAWLRRYQEIGDEHRCKSIEKDVRALKDKIDRRLQERGLSPRYGPGENAPEHWTGQL